MQAELIWWLWLPSILGAIIMLVNILLLQITLKLYTEVFKELAQRSRQGEKRNERDQLGKEDP